jgi:hypothetical protein
MSSKSKKSERRCSCGRTEHEGTGYCVACIQRQREDARCPDCDSVVTMVMASDPAEVYAAVLHSGPTCPNWQANKTLSGPPGEYTLWRCST